MHFSKYANIYSMRNLIRCILFISTTLFSTFTWAKIEPPNYNFSVDTLKDFYPDAQVSDLEKKYGKPEMMSGGATRNTLKFMVAQIRYKFPVIVQTQDGKVLDMFAKLPSYFLHDIFHHSLINRLGKQDQYKRTGEEAIYVWNKTPLIHVYSGACTITCFPVFYAVYPKEIDPTRPFTPIMDQMKKANQ